MPPNVAETPSKPQSPLGITHDGEFYARLLIKESSLANPSFRYYGAAERASELEMPPNVAETPSKPQSPLRITQDGEFYARLLTKESSLANPSFRYYGAGPGAVPFSWESQPGTPKDASCRMLAATVVVPAITPPPSYHLRAAPHGHSGRPGGGGARSKPGAKNCGRSKYCVYKLKWIKIGFIAAVLRRLALGKSRASSSSSSSAASVQSSSSTRWLFSGSSSVEETADQQRYYEPATKGVLCLGVRPSPWMV